MKTIRTVLLLFILLTLGGALLALWGLRRLDAAGVPVATIGMALFARGTRTPALGGLLEDLRRAVGR
jgi:hypothetical protein